MSVQAPIWGEKEEHSASQLCAMAYDEDAVEFDVTTRLCTHPSTHASVALCARNALCLAGMPILPLIFPASTCTLASLHQDGDYLHKNTCIATIRGPAYMLLSRERIALNFLQHLSGIATLTHAFVTRVDGTGASIVDTRKTLPGWRVLEKYAVRCGGGVNHRMALDDMIMLKDNHWSHIASEDRAAFIAHARAQHGDVPIACEADTVEEALERMTYPIDILMCDNMSLDDLRHVVSHKREGVCIEATGGITMANVRHVAETGVDRISIGALTHSAPACDIGCDEISA